MEIEQVHGHDLDHWVSFDLICPRQQSVALSTKWLAHSTFYGWPIYLQIDNVWKSIKTGCRYGWDLIGGKTPEGRERKNQVEYFTKMQEHSKQIKKVCIILEGTVQWLLTNFED